MTKLKLNPFKFGNPVEGDYYLPREKLTQLVKQFLQNQIHVVLIGPRRFGKTSFVLNVLKELENDGYDFFFVDIFNITSHKDFLSQLVRAISAKKKWYKRLQDKIPKLRPKMSFDIDQATGEQSFGLSMEDASDKDIKEAIQDVLSSLEKLGKNVIIAIDEFQKIADIADSGWLEATLRTHMQQLKNTSFLFTGSRRSIIYDMLNNSARPFYRLCQSIEFPSFGDEFSTWIVNRFKSISIDCQIDIIDDLRDLVQDTPNYVQMICFHLAASHLKSIHSTDVKEALDRIVGQNAYAYQTQLNSLSRIQQRTLRLAAHEPQNVYSKSLLTKFEITSPPALASAIKALKAKGIIEDIGAKKSQFVFDDPLFAIWLKKLFD